MKSLLPYLLLFLLPSLLLTQTLDDLKRDLISKIDSAVDVESLKESLQLTIDPLLKLPSSTSPIVIVGGGLSGLTSTLYLLEKGHSVTLVDREKFLGGNSAKASSGINGAFTTYQESEEVDDSADVFFEDTLSSSMRDGDNFTVGLIKRMVYDSKEAVEWLFDRASIPPPILVGQMGGHSGSRTHRPESGLAGAAFISGLEKSLSKYKKKGQLAVLTGTRVVGIDRGDNDGWRVDAIKESSGKALHSIDTAALIICTGGFGNDKDGEKSLLREVAPDLLNLASTNGKFTTGDGIKLAREAGAGTIDLDMVQVHPTGFSDVPKGFSDAPGRSLILCAEILRGSGAVLLEREGKRFIDELETRKTVTRAMNELNQGKYAIVVPPDAAALTKTHMNIYTGKGLLHAVEGVGGVEQFIARRLNENTFPPHTLSTFEEMSSNSSKVPRKVHSQLPVSGTYHVGIVEPVLHYTMGGLMVDGDGRVLDKEGAVIPDLYAAGEVMGGVHGENRLGGSSLLDCVVFGLNAAKSVCKSESVVKFVASNGNSIVTGGEKKKQEEVVGERKVVTIKGKKYDVTDFIDTHPGGPIHVEDGEDLTARFTQAHGNDFSLLDRDAIREINSSGVVVEREKKFYEDYGSAGGSWREFLGRRAWFILHSFAAKYPDNPSAEDKVAIRGLIAAFGQLYPCKLCRTHLQQQLRDPALGPPGVESREALTVWMCELHNIVNADLGKPQQDCNAFKVDLMYLKDCGECEVKKPTTEYEVGVEGKVEVKDPYYVGPWDAIIYRRGDEMLNSVMDNGEVWEARDVAELVDAMEVLKKWYRAFSKKDIKKMKDMLVKGGKERDQLGKMITEVMRGAMEGVDKGKLWT